MNCLTSFREVFWLFSENWSPFGNGPLLGNWFLILSGNRLLVFYGSGLLSGNWSIFAYWSLYRTGSFSGRWRCNDHKFTLWKLITFQETSQFQETKSFRTQFTFLKLIHFQKLGTFRKPMTTSFRKLITFRKLNTFQNRINFQNLTAFQKLITFWLWSFSGKLPLSGYWLLSRMKRFSGKW